MSPLMHRLAGTTLAGTLALLTLSVGCRQPTSRAKSLLLITLDTTRADHLGPYGYAAAQTPTLDRLAAEGVVFERAYSAVPETLPSHTTMLTGLYPPSHGVWLALDDRPGAEEAYRKVLEYQPGDERATWALSQLQSQGELRPEDDVDAGS